MQGMEQLRRAQREAPLQGQQPELSGAYQDDRAQLASLILDNAQDFISIIDAQTFRVLATSKSVLDLVGQPEGEVLGQTCYKLFFGLDGPDEGPCDPCPLIMARTSDGPVTVDKVYEAPDGRRMHLEVTVSPPGGSGGSLHPAVYVVRDITDRKRVEQALEAERHRLDTVLANSPDGIIHVDSLTGLVQANRSAQEMLECSFSTTGTIACLAGKCYGRDGDLIPLGRLPVSRALRGEVIVGEELLIRRAEGPSLPVLCSASPIRDGSESIVGAILQIQDLTAVAEARRRSEELAKEREWLLEAIEQERSRLQTLVDTSPVGIFLVGTGGEVVLVNREAQRILRLMGMPLHPLEWFVQNLVYRRPNGTTYRPEELPLLRSLATGETVVAEEMRFHFPNGGSTLTLVSTVPLRSSGGAITGAMAVIQDLTTMEESERQRAEFLGVVSHELRTPLAAMKATAAMVLGSRQYSDSPDTRELFQIVNDQADRLTNLVNNLLDMTRVEAGVLSINPQPTDLKPLLRETVDTFRQAYDRETHLSVPDGLPPARVDRRRIGQVVTNLLTNAAKFSARAQSIALDCTHDDTFVTIRVRDQGRGIPQEQMGLLFKKFSRIPGSSGAGLEGSGLGLAIAKGIVEAHGGRIWAESDGEGRGATFTFTVPVSAEAVTTTLSPLAGRVERRGRVTRPGDRASILVIDDDPHVLRFLRRSLDEAGYQPIVSTDPGDTMRLVEGREPDLVLLDLILPGTSGFDLLERIREFSAVPVIFLTSSDAEEHTVRALKMGADDYVTKPFSPSELLARIETALRRHAAREVPEVHLPFSLGDLVLDFAERQVTVGGNPVSLSATEYKILYELAVNAGRVLTHDQILQKVWGPEYSGETELVRSMVRNLRRKLGDDARHPRYIHTEPQVGYRLPKL